ncbi:MAG: type I restriction endonuclease, partial [Candidatus Dojkabacteria bacterium]|nr:type I restriction endonuclease [Candidatus Dojkabacteria bacterium]
MSLYENFTEDLLEEAAIQILKELGYEHIFAPYISYDGEYPEREDYKEVILKDRVMDALYKINKGLPTSAIEDAYRQIITFNSPMLEENNRYFHRLLTEGVEVSYKENNN